MIVNLTPHPLHIYPLDTPDRIDPGTIEPLRVIAPSAAHEPARLGQWVVGPHSIDVGVPVDQVVFGADTGLASSLPEPRNGTYYVVSLVVGLATAHREDLLVPHEYVRDLDGAVIGSRKLAHPQRP